MTLDHFTGWPFSTFSLIFYVLISRLDHDLRLTQHQAAVRIQEALHGSGAKAVSAGLHTASRWPQNIQVMHLYITCVSNLCRHECYLTIFF